MLVRGTPGTLFVLPRNTDIGLYNFTALLRLAIFESVTNSLESTGSKLQKFRAFTMSVAIYWALQERQCAFACKGVCESIEMKCFPKWHFEEVFDLNRKFNSSFLQTWWKKWCRTQQRALHLRGHSPAHRCEYGDGCG
jgi:hypothetical protein